MNDVNPSFFRASVFFLCVPSAEVLDVQGFFSAT